MMDNLALEMGTFEDILERFEVDVARAKECADYSQMVRANFRFGRGSNEFIGINLVSDDWDFVRTTVLRREAEHVGALTRLSEILAWQEGHTDYVNSIQDAINDAKAKAEDFNSREKVRQSLRSFLVSLLPIAFHI